MSDTIDNQTEQQYNQSQSPDTPAAELSREELQNQLAEKYEQVLLSNNLEEIAKVEEELQKFLGGGGGVESSVKVDEPEVPPANTEANQSTTVPAEGGTSAKEGATSQSEPSNPNEDWLHSLDPSVRKIVEERLEQERKAREYHEQRYRSEIGRQTAFQKKYEEERKQREQLEQRLRDGAVSQPSNPTATPANTQTANARKIQELTDKIARVKGTDPELADLLELTRDALVETQQLMASSVPKVDMSAVEELKVKLAEQEEARLVEQSRFELERQMPGALDFIDYVDPKTKWSPWQQFLQEMPEHLQRWYQADPFSPSIHKELLKNYYPGWASQYNAAHGYVQQQQPTQQPSQPEVDPRAAQVQQARQARLTTSAAAPARSAPPPGHKPSLEERIKNPPPPGTPEFDSFLEEMDRAIAQGKLKL
jgi:hypothetical protein